MRRQRRGGRWWLVCLVIGTMAPSETSAQDVAVEGADAAGELRDETTSAARDLADPSGAPEPEHVELSIGIAPTLAGLVGGVGLQAAAELRGAMDVAVPLGSRALFTLGGDVSATQTSGFESLVVRVPLSLLFYLERPRTGFVPTLRVLLRGTYSEQHSDSGIGVGVSLSTGVRGGLTYSFADEIALRAELGAAVGLACGPNFTNVGLELESALAVVLRM